MKVKTQVDEQLAQAQKRHQHDTQRAEIIARTRRFKASWYELADALTACQKQKLYAKWGYSSFEEYFRKELRLKPATVNKLVGTFAYLRRVAPQVLERDGVQEPLPSVESVEFLRRAAELWVEGKAHSDLVEAVRVAVIEEGASAAALERKFRPALFPEGDAEVIAKKRREAARTASQLSTRLTALRGSVEPQVEPALNRAVAAIEQLLAALSAVQGGTPPASPSSPAVAVEAEPERPALGPELAEEDARLAAEVEPEATAEAEQSAAEQRNAERVNDAHRKAVVYLCTVEQGADEAALRRMRKSLQWKLAILSDQNLVRLAACFPGPQWKQVMEAAAEDPDLRRHLNRALRTVEHAPPAGLGLPPGPRRAPARPGRPLREPCNTATAA